jgi:hypothetical protein
MRPKVPFDPEARIGVAWLLRKIRKEQRCLATLLASHTLSEEEQGFHYDFLLSADERLLGVRLAIAAMRPSGR